MSEVVNQFVDVKAIRPHPRNYKIHPEQQIQQLGMSHARLNQFIAHWFPSYGGN